MSREIVEKSSNVVRWYLHKYDTSTGGKATIRGPFHRWVTVHEGADPTTMGNKDQCGLVDVQDDAEFICLAMNEYPHALDLIQSQQALIKELLSVVEFYAEADNYMEEPNRNNLYTIIVNDASNPEEDDTLRFGGKRAREVLLNNRELIERIK